MSEDPTDASSNSAGSPGDVTDTQRETNVLQNVFQNQTDKFPLDTMHREGTGA